MSVEAITWALKCPIERSSAKFVLVAMANCADGRDFVCWPSVGYLADATAQDRKTVMNNIRMLLDSGYLEDTGRRFGMTKQVIVYRLITERNSTKNGMLPGGGDACNGAENGTVKEYQKRDDSKVETVPKTDGKEYQKRYTEPSMNRKPKTSPLTPHGVPPQGEPSGNDVDDQDVVATASDAACPASHPDAEQPAKREKRVTLNTWLDSLRQSGEPAISQYQPLLAYVAEIGLPMEFVQLAWDEFKRQHGKGGTNAGRRQADWRRHFRNCIERNWYRLWFMSADGQFSLTSAGLVAKRLHDDRVAA